MWPFSSKPRTCAACAQLKIDVAQLDAQLQALRAQHLSLRGRVYALWGKEKGGDGTAGAAGSPAGGSPTAAPGARLSREELRRLAGLKPGHAYPHRDTQPTSEE